MKKAGYRREISSGGVIFKKAADGFRICLIARIPTAQYRTPHGRGVWCLPKGKVERGEDSSQTALREVKEETGLEGSVLRKLSNVHYWYYDRAAKANVNKTVSFYLVRYRKGRMSHHDREVHEARWFPLAQAARRLSYPTERQILKKARGFLKGHYGKTV